MTVALGVRRHFDLLADGPALRGQRAVGQEPPVQQATLGLVEVPVGPGSGTDVGAERQAPVELGQQADLGGVQPG